MNGWERTDEANSEFLYSKLFGTIEKKDGPVPYLAIRKKFLDLINSTDNHPLKGKFKTLSELNKLEKCFPKDVIKKLPGGRIFANRPIRFSNGKQFKAACIPYIHPYIERAKAVNFAETLSKTYAELFYPEQSQAVQQPQPAQEQSQQPPQPQQPKPPQDQVSK